MAASDDPPTESQTDDKWVFVQDGGGAVKELLLQEEHGDARGGMQFWRWCRSAWNDILVRNNTWDDARPYILGVAVSANAVLHLLAAFASSVDILDAVLTFLRDVTMAALCIAPFSYATRFLSLLAARASVVKKLELKVLLFCLLGTNAAILGAGSVFCICAVGTGLASYGKATLEAWYLRLPVVLRWPVFIGAVGSVPLLMALMATDVVTTLQALELHWPAMKEARNVFTKRWLHPLKPVLLTALLTVVCFFVICGIVFTLAAFDVISLNPATPAASDGI
ncbi:hypothetical protein MTO96_017029 [Rhipicephalus appendiculatus]